MAISVNHTTLVITIPKADTTLVSAGPPEIREYNVDTLLKTEMHSYLAGEDGIVLDNMFQHNTTVTISGVVLARVIELLAPYTVSFEPGAYRVNLIGANNNVQDVLNYNVVQSASSNSAGLIQATSSITTVDLDNIADAVLDESLSGHTSIGTVGEALNAIDDSSTAFTIGTGSTTTEVRTDAAQATGFFDKMLITIENTAGKVVREISSYSVTNGAFTLNEALPFTPSSGDLVRILQIVSAADTKSLVDDAIVVSL